LSQQLPGRVRALRHPPGETGQGKCQKGAGIGDDKETQFAYGRNS
jgi:hypothetical protein